MDVRVQIRSKKGNSVQEVVISGRDQFVLGRGPSSAAPLDGPGISREHLAVSLDLSDILVTDISVNGAWINGKPLPQKEKYRLKPGEVVEVPDYELTFQVVNNGDGSEETAAGDAPFAPAGPETSAPATSLKGNVSAFLSTFSTLDLLMIVVSIFAVIVVVLYFASA